MGVALPVLGSNAQGIMRGSGIVRELTNKRNSSGKDRGKEGG